jgi:hypothetical protein
MKAAITLIGVLAALASAAALADEDEGSGRRASRPAKPSWEFGVTAYPTDVRGGENYTSVIAVADRGPLHLELRHNYEAINATSAFVGWTFSGGETVAWELTPLLGFVRGTKQAFAPGLEASLTWGRLDYYIEAEYVNERNASADSYFYAWSELGFKALEWLRIGAVAQRTRIYGGERELQRGPFAQVSLGRAKLGAYWFNPGSNERVFVASIGVTF